MIHDCDFRREETVCGCIVERCGLCEAARSVEKCKLHKSKEHDSRYYYLVDLHGHSNGVPMHTKIASEFELALIEMNVDIPIVKPTEAKVLDIGAGIGYNAPIFMQRGYRYEALELDSWACKYIKGAYSPHTHNISYEDFNIGGWDAIIASHVLEHFKDAKSMLTKMYNNLKPGGLLLIVIPDDSDLGNPDHLWFFKQNSIKMWFEELGFENIKYIQKKVVICEDFIYIAGQKPF